MARADRARALFGLHPRGSALDRGSCCGHSHLARLFPVLPHRREIWSGAAGAARRDPRLARGARPSPRDRKSVVLGKSGSERVDIDGGPITKNTNIKNNVIISLVNMIIIC